MLVGSSEITSNMHGGIVLASRRNLLPNNNAAASLSPQMSSSDNWQHWFMKCY